MSSTLSKSVPITSRNLDEGCADWRDQDRSPWATCRPPALPSPPVTIDSGPGSADYGGRRANRPWSVLHDVWPPSHLLDRASYRSDNSLGGQLYQLMRRHHRHDLSTHELPRPIYNATVHVSQFSPRDAQAERGTCMSVCPTDYYNTTHLVFKNTTEPLGYVLGSPVIYKTVLRRFYRMTNIQKGN